MIFQPGKETVVSVAMIEAYQIMISTKSGIRNNYSLFLIVPGVETFRESVSWKAQSTWCVILQQKLFVPGSGGPKCTRVQMTRHLHRRERELWGQLNSALPLPALGIPELRVTGGWERQEKYLISSLVCYSWGICISLLFHMLSGRKAVLVSGVVPARTGAG